MNKTCILENKPCINCRKCDDICDLDPKKICNSCGKCIEGDGKNFSIIKITKIVKD